LKTICHPHEARIAGQIPAPSPNSRADIILVGSYSIRAPRGLQEHQLFESVRHELAVLQFLARLGCWSLHWCRSDLAGDPRGVGLSNAGLFRPQASAKVHTFRIATAAAAWLLIIASFYYHPEWIKWALRNITYAIETAADAIPYPWGDRIEIALRELGGFVWFQITLAIVSLRIALSTVAAAWRRISQQ